MTLIALVGSLELGILYAIMALGVFISFRTLNTADLTVDGSFVLGAACSAVLTAAGYPLLGLLVGLLAGMGAGVLTALLTTKLKILPLLSSILVMLALYSVNLRVMGKANISLMNTPTVFNTLHLSFGDAAKFDATKLVVGLAFLLIVMTLLFLFLKTKVGFALRATGDNQHMVRACGIDTDRIQILGLALANGLVGLSGGLIAQYQKFTDVSMGTGMVVIGLASVIIGEAIFGTRPLLRRLCAVVLGSILYRLVIAFAFQLGMPATDLKLVSAVIVTIALSAGLLSKPLRKHYHAKDKGGAQNA